MVSYDNEFETMGNKTWTKDKIEWQHIHRLQKIVFWGIYDFKYLSNNFFVLGVGIAKIQIKNNYHTATFVKQLLRRMSDTTVVKKEVY